MPQATSQKGEVVYVLEIFGDIFDISVKDTVEIQGLIEKQKTVISGHTTLIDFLPPQ
jgi:hypothetical protein